MTNERRPSGYERNGYTWAKTRQRIITRDNGICYLCGKPGADTADHVTPVHRHGGHHDGNLRAAHRQPCHAEKTERERLAALRARTRRRTPRTHPNLTT